MSEHTLFSDFWAAESETTGRVLARIPEGSEYRPDPMSRTAKEIAWQITCEEAMLADSMEQGKLVFSDPPVPATMREVLEQYQRQAATIPQRLRALADERWSGTLEWGGKARPAAPMAWSFLFDIVHHRGQITTYLRPMGSKVPQVYGPSYDEP